MIKYIKLIPNLVRDYNNPALNKNIRESLFNPFTNLTDVVMTNRNFLCRFPFCLLLPPSTHTRTRAQTERGGERLLWYFPCQCHVPPKVAVNGENAYQIKYDTRVANFSK